MQSIQTSVLPFASSRKTLEIPEGLNLGQIVSLVFPKPIRGLEIVVNVGDEVIPRDNWRHVKPKQHAVVGINVVPAGGGGKKNPLTIVLSIAIAIAAPYLASVYGVALGSAMFGGGVLTASQMAIAQGIISIGVSMVGYLAMSMLASTPKQSSSTSESKTQFVEGSTNTINKFGVIPANLGVNRVFPPQAALPFTETVGNDQYVRQLFTYGYGNVVVGERKFGETLISEYDYVEVEDKLNGNLSDGLSLYANDVYQDGLSVNLTNATGYVLRTTQTGVDEAVLDVTFSSGLVAYSAKGNKYGITVNFSIEYAPTGTSDWSNGTAGLSVLTQSISIPAPVLDGNENGVLINTGWILLNKKNGVAKIVTNSTVPEDYIRIGSYTTNANRSSTSIVDERASYIPSVITSGFGLSVSGTNIVLASGALAPAPFSVYASTTQALRVFKRIVFPSRGKYDVRIKRLTADTSSDKISDVATWTALKSVTYVKPVNKADISGTAIRIKATDQLSGTIERYNVILSTIVDYWNGSAWVTGVSSNPAALYRYVLQSPAFVKALPDGRIDLTKIEEWSEYCDANGLTYNRVIDYETSIDDVLKDITAAGMATPQKVNGNYSVIIDNERPTIKGMVTPRNSWNYKGNINYPEIPHALRVQFRNKDKGYELDERIVYADGYDETNAIEFERLEFNSCTNSDLAWFYGRRYLATAILQPETHTFSMDFENLSFNRGDRIVFVNDTVLIGVGQGRIKSLITDGTNVTGFTIDDIVEIPNSNQFGVRVRQNDASGFDYYSLVTSIGEADTFTLATPVLIADGPQIGSLCTFTEFGNEVDLVITEIKMGKDQSATVSAVNYAPERLTSTSGVIPVFNSHITLPIGLSQPEAPQLAGAIQSNEAVMLKNSDGSYTSRMLIPLTNLNEPSVLPVVLVQVAGATQWERAQLIDNSANLVGITGLQDGSIYNIAVRYQRQSGQMLLSSPLSLNNVVFEGASGRPADVENFRMSTSGSTALFDWTPNIDIDLSHYVMRFNRLTTGAVWISSQVIADDIQSNRLSLPVQSGTYLIKAVDILGNESENATVVISFNTGALNNVVETLTQQTAWTGTKTNVSVVSGALRLTDTTLPGYYYFDPSSVDLGGTYESILSSSIVASAYRNVGGVYIRAISSIRSLTSVRGVINPVSWAVNIQMNKDGAGWEPFTVGGHIFQTIELRLELLSYEDDVTPNVEIAEVVIDMPDRIERDTGLTAATGGTTVTYPVPFKNDPAVNVTLQNGEVDDKLVFISKSSSGFTLKVYNATAAGYVSRVFDYASVGYGRVL